MMQNMLAWQTEATWTPKMTLMVKSHKYTGMFITESLQLHHHWSCWENRIPQTHMHTQKKTLEKFCQTRTAKPLMKNHLQTLIFGFYFLTICLIFSYKLDNVPATKRFSRYKLFPCCLAAASKWDQPSPSISCCVKGSKVYYTHYPSHFKQSNLDSHTRVHACMHARTHTHTHTHTHTRAHTHTHTQQMPTECR